MQQKELTVLQQQLHSSYGLFDNFAGTIKYENEMNPSNQIGVNNRGGVWTERSDTQFSNILKKAVSDRILRLKTH